MAAAKMGDEVKMQERRPIGEWRQMTIWTSVAIYGVARVCQMYADRLPSLMIVLLHVAPPAIFALAHGSAVYGRRGIAVFAGICVGVATVNESLSLRTGFPYGHYYFTNVMGPKLFGLPGLLVLAYLGIGYCSWVLALLILGCRNRPLSGVRVIALPILASLVMTLWDLSMDAAWATIDKAWIWQDGGAFYGVPVSNFFGWSLTTYLVYQTFALYCSRQAVPPAPDSHSFWRAPILFYGLCAFGNILLFKVPIAAVVTDESGRAWATSSILGASAVVSALVMGPLAILAWLRVMERVEPTVQ